MPSTRSSVESEYRVSDEGSPQSGYERVSTSDSVLVEVDDAGKQMDMLGSSSTVTMAQHVLSVGSRTVLVLMLGAYVIATSFIVAHHIFLVALNGEDVGEYIIPQTWVRDIGNALARVVQILLETSVGVALTQSIWFYARRSAVTVPELDDLFSLPSAASIPFVILRSSALYVLPIAANIQAFSLIGIFAPNALSIVPAGITSSVLSVPFVALDQIAPTDSIISLSANESYGEVGWYLSPSTGFKTLVQTVLSKGDILPWNAPSGCGLACNYSISYNGPSLRCRDIDPSSIAVYQDDTLKGDATLPWPYHMPSDPADWRPEATIDALISYNGTGTLGSANRAAGLSLGADTYTLSQEDAPYSLSLVYTLTPGPYDHAAYYPTQMYGGTYCEFVNATYDASVQFVNGSGAIDVHVSEYLGPYQSFVGLNTTTQPSQTAALGLLDAMTRYLVGTATVTVVMASYNTQILEGAALFTIHVNSTTIGLLPTGGQNISQALESLCTKLTASLMSDTANLGVRTQVPATVLADKTIYAYQPTRLWLVYGIALGVALIADLFGLACMRSNGVAMQRNFSSIAASMRAPELNELLSGPEEAPRAAAKVAKLRYSVGGGNLGERSGFRVVERAEDEVRIGETTALNAESGEKRA
ncbi:unnamed protein product [Peniophora sp. CBMAI 1063]|nr:unnamed protein product [Peniophora sp. CBMAI 1063]